MAKPLTRAEMHNMTQKMKLRFYGTSMFERRFEAMLREFKITGWVKEFKFHPDRNFRADFAFPELKLLVELEGGVWSGGAHVTGSGYTKDCIKYNLATLAGYSILRYTSEKTMYNFIEDLKEYKKRFAL